MPRRASPRAPKQKAPAEKKTTTERILDAAEERFARVGYEGTSLNDIADDVGIRTPSVYKHFEGKHAIYMAVLERLLAPYFDLLERLLSPEAAEDGAANVLAVLRHYVATPNLARLVQHATLAGGSELELLVTKWYAPLFARAAKLTPRGAGASAAESPMAVVVAFHSMMSGYMTMAPLHARLMGVDPYGDAAVAALLAMMQRLALELWTPPSIPTPRISRPDRRRSSP